MNKFFIISMLTASVLLVGCDKLKSKKDETASPAVSTWSCTSPENLKDLQGFLKQEYIKNLEKSLRESDYYEADQVLLKKINDSLNFEIKNIRTLTQDVKTATQLQCEGQIVVKFPKGLLKRAENAFLEQGGRCYEECGDGYATLIDYLEDREVPLTIQDDFVKGNFAFDVIKTDKEGFMLNAQHQNDVIQAVVTIAEKAVQYEAYVKENAIARESQEKASLKDAEQTELAQKAMDIRKKELEDDKRKVVERLNQTWDRFTDEQKAELQEDQSTWFEKRDVDCKVLSQKSPYQIAESEKETYQKQVDYWDDEMRAQNIEMEYTKCFVQRTNERIIYLNNVFN